MTEQIKLCDTQIDKDYIVDELQMTGIMKRRLQDFGLIPGTKITPLRRYSDNGPMAYRLRGSTYVLGKDDTEQILVHEK